MLKKITEDIFLQEYANQDELDEISFQLLNEARSVCDQAYAPYSNFKVGAAVLLDNGEMVTGANQENAAYPSGLCAERVALFAASTQYPRVPVKKIAVSAKIEGSKDYTEVTPCGGCRQVMIEFQSLQELPIAILMEGPSGKVYLANSVDMLLPFKFTRNSLKPE